MSPQKDTYPQMERWLEDEYGDLKGWRQLLALARRVAVAEQHACDHKHICKWDQKRGWQRRGPGEGGDLD